MGNSQYTEISDFAFHNRIRRWLFLVLPSKISVWFFRKFLEQDRELNSLSAAKFVLDAQKIYPTHYYLALRKCLWFALNLAHTELPNSYLRLFIDSVIETRRNPTQRKLISNRMLGATADLKQMQSSAHGWKLISLSLTGFGFIRAGTVARKYCLDSALREVTSGGASSRSLNLAIKGLMENRRFDEAINCIKSHTLDGEPTSGSNPYCVYIELLRKRQPNNTSSNLGETATADEISHELISAKTIALVATGEIKTFSGRDIDQHDTVAHVKFQGFDIMPISKFSGSRCDLTFYTEDLVDKFATKSRLDLTRIAFLKNVKLIVVKQKNNTQIGNIPIRSMELRAPTFMTTAASGTLFLFDLLRYEPKKVKLFGFNYYTDRQIYNSALLDFYKNSNAYKKIGLQKNWFDLSSHQRASATIASGFISHDPRSDFLLVKNLYELSGLIDGTPEVLEILNLTADEYDSRLEEMLGDW